MGLTPFLLIGLAALVITFVSTPVVRFASVKLGVIDRPSDRKVHANPTPTLGGLALFAGAAGAGAVAYSMPEFRETFLQTSELFGIAAGAVVIFALGAVDDLRDLPAPVKLSGQVFAAGILFLSGVKMQFVLLPGESISLSDDVSAIVTILWLVAMMNAINFVDGLDGLAAGIVAIAGSAFFVYTYRLSSDVSAGLFTSPLLAIIIVGVSLGFLRHNFFPAKIFMGDSGAMLLGLLLGSATVVGVGNAPLVSTSEVFLAYFPLLIPGAILLIPLLDGIFAIIRRARSGRGIFTADKQHLHHRLMDLGHGHRQAVIVLYIWSALAAGAGLAFSFFDRADLIFALPIAVGAIVVYTLFPLLTKLIQDRLSI